MFFEICLKWAILSISIVSAYVERTDVKLTFRGIEHTNFSNITSNLGDAITELSIKNSSFPKLSRDIFVRFKNVEILTLNNTQTEEIEEDTFYDLQHLRNLHIINNKLNTFSMKMISSNNGLSLLDLSNNLLTNISDFDIDTKPVPDILNISKNSLKYLPGGILDKLKIDSNFYIVIEDNPWDCSLTEWKQQLLTDKDLSYIFCPNETLLETWEKMLASSEEKSTEKPISIEPYSKSSSDVFRTRCVFWIFGAVWLGIILGNINQMDLKPRVHHHVNNPA